MDKGIDVIRRETFLSALNLTRDVLGELGLSKQEIDHTVETFRKLDRRRLYEDYAHYTDLEKLRAHAKKQSEELEELFRQDAKDLEEGRSEKKRKP